MEPVAIDMSDTQMPSAGQVAKGRAVLKQLIATKQLSPEGLKWLTFALDPFHDKEIKGIEGIPDGNTGKSVVCSVVQEITVKKPPGLGAGNWSCRICTYPVAARQVLASGKCFGNIVNNQGAGLAQIAPIQISYALDGNDFPEFGEGSDYLEIPAAFTKGPFKVGALGVEIINTTAALTRQGFITCARMNQTSCKSYCAQIFNNDIARYTFAELFNIRTCPINLSQMNLLTGNTAWPAELGAYMIPGLKAVETSQAKAQPVYPLLINDDFFTGAQSAAFDCAGPFLSLAPVPTLGLPGNPPIFSIPGFCGEVPMDSSIAMLTGLSDGTTTIVRGRWMIERFPNDLESEICVLAKPTAYLDPVALSIYSQVSQMMPAAVQFGENPKGEWWKRVLGAIADTIGAGLLAAPHPVAKVLGGGVLMGSKMLLPEQTTNKAVIENGQYVMAQRKAVKKKKELKNTQRNGAPPVPPRKKANGYKK